MDGNEVLYGGGVTKCAVSEFMTPHKVSVMALIDIFLNQQKNWDTRQQRLIASLLCRLTTHQMRFNEPGWSELLSIIAERVTDEFRDCEIEESLSNLLEKYVNDNLRTLEDLYCMMDRIYERIQTDTVEEAQDLTLGLKISTNSKLALYVRRGFMELADKPYMKVANFFAIYLEYRRVDSFIETLVESNSVQRPRRSGIESSPLLKPESMPVATINSEPFALALRSSPIPSSCNPRKCSSELSLDSMKTSTSLIYPGLHRSHPNPRLIDQVIASSRKRKASVTHSLREQIRNRSSAAIESPETAAIVPSSPMLVGGELGQGTSQRGAAASSLELTDAGNATSSTPAIETSAESVVQLNGNVANSASIILPIIQNLSRDVLSEGNGEVVRSVGSLPNPFLEPPLPTLNSGELSGRRQRLDDNNQPMSDSEMDLDETADVTGGQLVNADELARFGRMSSSKSMFESSLPVSRTSTPSMMGLRQMHIPSSPPLFPSSQSHVALAPKPRPLRSDVESSAFIEEVMAKQKFHAVKRTTVLSAYDVERYMARLMERFNHRPPQEYEAIVAAIARYFPLQYQDRVELLSSSNPDSMSYKILGSLHQRSFTARTLTLLAQSQMAVTSGDFSRAYKFHRHYFDVMKRQAGNQGIAALMGTNDLADLLATTELYSDFNCVTEAANTANRAVIVARETRARHELLKALNWLYILSQRSRLPFQSDVSSHVNLKILVQSLPDPEHLIASIEKAQPSTDAENGSPQQRPTKPSVIEPRALNRMAGLVQAENLVTVLFLLVQLLTEKLKLLDPEKTNSYTSEQSSKFGQLLNVVNAYFLDLKNSPNELFSLLFFLQSLSQRVHNKKLQLVLANLEGVMLAEFGNARASYTKLVHLASSPYTSVYCIKETFGEQVLLNCNIAQLAVRQGDNFSVAWDFMSRIIPIDQISQRQHWLKTFFDLFGLRLLRLGYIAAAEIVADMGSSLLHAASDSCEFVLLKARCLAAQGLYKEACDVVHPILYPNLESFAAKNCESPSASAFLRKAVVDVSPLLLAELLLYYVNWQIEDYQAASNTVSLLGYVSLAVEVARRTDRPLLYARAILVKSKLWHYGFCRPLVALNILNALEVGNCLDRSEILAQKYLTLFAIYKSIGHVANARDSFQRAFDLYKTTLEDLPNLKRLLVAADQGDGELGNCTLTLESRFNSIQISELLPAELFKVIEEPFV